MPIHFITLVRQSDPHITEHESTVRPMVDHQHPVPIIVQKQ